MRNPFSQALKIFFSPETIVPFLIGSVCLALVGNVIYDMLKNSLGTTTPDLLKIGAIALFILVGAVATVGWIIAQRLAHLPDQVPFEVQQKKLDRRYRGLILLVSNVEASETAIRFHLPTLQACWLICSPHTLNRAQNLCRQFPQVCQDQPIVINDVYNPLLFCHCVNSIYRTRLPQGWQEAEVIADYTGMTAHASVGMVLACVGTQRPLQYTPAKVNGEGKAIGSLDPIAVSLLRPDVTQAASRGRG